MSVLYNIGIYVYVSAARIMSFFDEKARQWTYGRRGWKDLLHQRIVRDEKYIWIHCASLGEFEQGRPVIEAIRKNMPGKKIILTFFSPSGYEIRKNYSGADVVCYLPADTPGNAESFVSMVNPGMAVFVKYEFWNNYTLALRQKGVPLYLISGIFRPDQHFFKWYGSFFKKILFRFTHIFVQDSGSLELLKGIGLKNVSLAGDTRFDRVLEIAGSADKIDKLDMFRGDEKLFLAGSSWKPDEEIISGYINRDPDRMKWIFAPHEIDESNICRLESLFSTSVVRFSGLTAENTDARVLIIDNIGMLSSAYRYAYIAAIGGGFGKGIHNILEAACWGVPVIFGPNYKNFREAVDLINQKGASSFKTFEEFSDMVDRWLKDEEFYLKSAKTAREFIKQNAGATRVIMSKFNPKDINNQGSKLVNN